MSRFYSILPKIKNFTFSCFGILKQAAFTSTKYRILTVEKDENDEYMALVQVINKHQTFRMKPELILADDHLTDAFSPRDIRSLTYLGYLGINSPKYKILAQRLSEKDEKLFFAIQEKGKNNLIVKSAEEISANTEILKSLNQKDAHMVGFATASAQASVEKKIKQGLITNSTKDQNLLVKRKKSLTS